MAKIGAPIGNKNAAGNGSSTKQRTGSAWRVGGAFAPIAPAAYNRNLWGGGIKGAVIGAGIGAAVGAVGYGNTATNAKIGAAVGGSLGYQSRSNARKAEIRNILIANLGGRNSKKR